jgi:hypothetical protein
MQGIHPTGDTSSMPIARHAHGILQSSHLSLSANELAVTDHRVDCERIGSSGKLHVPSVEMNTLWSKHLANGCTLFRAAVGAQGNLRVVRLRRLLQIPWGIVLWNPVPSVSHPASLKNWIKLIA